MRNIAVVGGTGDLGFGLAVRLAKNHNVTIGSRDAARANEAASKASSLSGATVKGSTNEQAARECELAILAIPDLPSEEMLVSLKPSLAGKLVISPIVPMQFKDGLFSISVPDGSAAERVASVLQTKVAGAFHNVPAQKLIQVSDELNYDVLVTAESKEIFAEAAEIVSSVSRLRPLYAGTL